MAENSINLNGFGYLTKKLQENNVKTDTEELSSLFSRAVEDSEDGLVSSLEFSKLLSSAYGIDVSSDILNTLDDIAQTDKASDLSLADFENYKTDNTNKYININSETIKNIPSNATILTQDGEIKVSDYINTILSSDISMSEQECKEYALNYLTQSLEQSKQAFQAQEDSDGLISKGYNFLKELFGLGTSNKDVEKMISNQEEMINALTDAMNGKGDLSFEEAWEKYTGTPYSQEKMNEYVLTSAKYQAIMIGCQYDSDYMDNFEKATGQSVNDVMKDFILCKQETFGKNADLEMTFEKYQQDQETFTSKLSSAISMAGLACTVISFVCPAAGVALLPLGRALQLSGMFIDNGLQLIDNATDKDGLTLSEVKDLSIETGSEVLGYLMGKKIGGFTGNINNKVTNNLIDKGVNKIFSAILGQAAETTTDAALSLGTDFFIAEAASLGKTGEFIDLSDYWSADRFFGEGKNQLISILSGVTQGKVAKYQQTMVENAKTQILSGDIDSARESIKKSGLKIADGEFDEFVDKIKISDSLTKSISNLDTVKQDDSSTCAVVSILNAINAKPMLAQALINEFEYDPTSNTYKFSMFGDDFEVKLNEGENLLQKVYDAYEITYGKDVSGDFVSRVYSEILGEANDIIVKPTTDNLETLKTYSEDENSILTFNTSDDIEGLTKNHSYTVMGIDENGNIKLQDPLTLEEVTISKAQYENMNCQIEGKTLSGDGIVDGGVRGRIVAGNRDTEYKMLNLASEEEIEDYLAETKINVTVQDGFWSTRTQTVELGEWLQRYFGVTSKDINPSAFEFLQRLNSDVIQKLAVFGDNNDCIVRMLTKTGDFSDIDFSAILKNADFLNLLSETKANGNDLFSRVSNIGFMLNKDFDVDGMTKLLKVFETTRIIQHETKQWNFSMLDNLTCGRRNPITDILNSTTIDYSKTAEFLEEVSNIKIKKANGTEWSFADILKENWLYNTMFDENMDYDRIVELFKIMTASDNYKCMPTGNIEFEANWLSSHLNGTKYSTIEEYFDAFTYFASSNTEDNSTIFNGRSGRMTLDEVIEKLMGIDVSSVEASNYEMLIQLVEEGAVDKHVFEYMPSAGKITSAVVSDIDKLYEAYSLGLEPKEMFIPSFGNLKEAMEGGNEDISFKGTYKELKIGDVFQVDGEDYIRIKTSDTESKLLNISKDTYFKLFPPIERYATTQNDIGNCWEITGINSLLCEDDTRESVLSLFSEDGSDIVIKFPNSELDEIRFDNGKLPDFANTGYLSRGALGVQMLEFADGKDMQNEWIANAYKKINKMIAEADSESKKAEFERGLEAFAKFVEEHSGNIVIDFNGGVHWSTYNGNFDTVFTANRKGGVSNNLYRKLGYKNAQDLYFYDKNGWARSQELLSDLSSFDRYIISWASDGKDLEHSVNSTLGIVSNHAYRIKPKQINPDGTVETFILINPWGMMETELTYQQVLDYGKALYIADK